MQPFEPAPIGFAGLMDDIAFFDRVLRQEEIQLVMSGDYRIFGLTDSTPPTIVLEGPSEQTIDKDASWIDCGFRAVDAEQGNLTSSVVVSGSVDVSKAGVYNIRYNVTDVAGNNAIEVIRRSKFLHNLTRKLLWSA